ncbi:hypothetical protein [Polaribacter sp.]|uniref:hypothetical protein n=1 Tax=Polaribacter sp. TaxID=1920175 RepID=UPI003F6BD144
MILNSLFTLYFIAIVIYAYNFLLKKFDIDLKYFVAYLFSMLSFELFIISFEELLNGNSLKVYNVLTFLEFNLLLLFIKEILSVKSSRKIVNYLIIIFNLVYFITSFYYLFKGNYFSTYNSISSVSGSFIITIAVFIFFKDFINSDRILNFKKSLSFWICVGLLVYYLGGIPATLTLNAITHLKRADHLFILNINPFLALCMYSIFIFGVLWSQKKE